MFFQERSAASGNITLFPWIPEAASGTLVGTTRKPHPQWISFNYVPVFLTSIKILELTEKAIHKCAKRIFARVRDFWDLRTGGKPLREKTIEQKLRIAVTSMGGLALKLVCPGMDGMPDRLILLPGGYIVFAELKAPGKQLRPLQAKRKRQLEELGFRVYVIDCPEQIGGVLDAI
jgi:hypothetical protein